MDINLNNQKKMTKEEAIGIVEKFSETETLRLNKFEHVALQMAINTLKEDIKKEDGNDESKNRGRETG
jgi:hypothetical protein